jgi:hypothetical protein
MPLEEVLVMASLSVNALSPTGSVVQLALKAPPQLDEGGRVGPRQEDWARKDDGGDQCNDKVGHVGVLSGGGRQR